MTKLFVGSLPYETTSEQLEELFGKIGKVQSATVITDKYSGRSKGFGFVEMSSEEEVKKAIDQLNGHKLGERNIVVAEARPPREKRGGSSFGQSRY
jgi:RNA recognition motif-containing protein